MSVVDTYYFDGGTVNDPLSYWDDDNDAFNSSDANRAESSTAHRDNASTKTSGYLEGVGTTAPSSGGSITQVRVRIAGNNVFGTLATYANVYDGSDDLGTVAGVAGSLGTYGNWITLDTPSGGWTWAKIQGLKLRYHTNGVAISETMGMYLDHSATRNEIEVTSDASTPTVGAGYPLPAFKRP